MAVKFIQAKKRFYPAGAHKCGDTLFLLHFLPKLYPLVYVSWQQVVRYYYEASIAPSWGTETVAKTKLYYNHNGNPPANLSYPAGCTPVQTTGSGKLYKLNATTNKTGLEFVIKVIAGDKIDILGKSYYPHWRRYAALGMCCWRICAYTQF